MPYARAPLWIGALLALVVVAFWPGYFGALSTAPLAFHLHGATATIWIALLAAQAATIHRRRIAWHRLAGRASLGFFPVLIAGMAGVEHSMAAAAPTDPFYAVHGARLGMIDLIAATAVAWLFNRALATRGRPLVHAHYMMATPLFLLSPIFGRLFAHHLPPLAMHGPPDFWRFGVAVELGNLAATAAALIMWRGAPRGHGRPFLVSAAVLAAQTALFPLVDGLAPWTTAFAAMGRTSPFVLQPIALAAAALVVWHGWTAGSARSTPRAAFA